MSLTSGMIIKELTFNTQHEPVINCLQDRTQWCVQMESNTVFLDSNFEPLYENGIVWKGIPTAIVQASPYVLALMNQSIDVCTFNGSQSVPVQQITQKATEINQLKEGVKNEEQKNEVEKELLSYLDKSVYGGEPVDDADTTPRIPVEELETKLQGDK